MPLDHQNLSTRQRRLLDEWFPGAVLEHDHSWGQVDRAVLELSQAGDRFIVKAGGPTDHHIGREVQAHLNWLEPWSSGGFAPILRHFDLEANLLVTGYLPGELVLGTPAAEDPESYRQAGKLLALLHKQAAVRDDDYEAAENQRSIRWLDGPHRIAPELERWLGEELSSWPTSPVLLVPTHGDWQPRNWLVDQDAIRIIDFGRAALRPAMSDFARLAAQDFRRNPRLEEAFLDGYGSDPREPGAWYRNRVREAIGTAAWAYQVADEGFEAQGHRMLAEVLSDRKTGKTQ
ncbi:hypothetical protein FHU41_001918 [Psychromicrobium silvestre]|uniref:Aminoglycoside phosphotransferase domain-containing protein n=1 Tax=Psychromicrobium silvestre TaxID=1645614 RepID=A0A7Y9LU64_9MICC|nr:phosphotransferase [Psychromicrobium silvestre]NYE95668.1 hypothetical protein [Psychromicrobium silvestre]